VPFGQCLRPLATAPRGALDDAGAAAEHDMRAVGVVNVNVDASCAALPLL